MIMDTLQSELQELKHFIADLKADRTAQKDKEKREAWTKYTTLSIVFIAVLAAVASVQSWLSVNSSVLPNPLPAGSEREPGAQDHAGQFHCLRRGHPSGERRRR